MSFKIVEVTLASDVADAGTFTVEYPSGTDQNTDWGDKSVIVVDHNDVFKEADSEIATSFGASNITITNDSGVTLGAGSFVRVQLDLAPGNDLVVAQGGQMPAITDPTGGDTTDTEARAAINDILAALREFGIIASS